MIVDGKLANVAFETAVADISRQLEEWKEYGLLV